MLKRDAAISVKNRPLVVLIEDDNRVAPALAMLIEDWGFECVAVRSPAAALDELGPRVCDIAAIVADLSREDAFVGRRSAEAIAGALGTNIPRIVTTNEPAMARVHGFSDVLAKPYEPETLRDWLRAQKFERQACADLQESKAG